MKMKNELLVGVASAAALISTASAASAADVVAPDDWSGLYAGVSVGSMFGDLPWANGNSTAGGHVYGLNSAAITPGGFVGFNSETSGGMVFGAELAAQFSTPANIQGSSYQYGLNNTIDAKARLGFDAGQFMPYVFVGASSQSVAGEDAKTYAAYGVNFGVGVDVKVADHMTIGAEYIRRQMSGFDALADKDVGFANNEISLRAAYHF